MRPLQLLLPLLAWKHLVLAEESPLLAAVGKLPQCAVCSLSITASTSTDRPLQQVCLVTAVAESSCSFTDAACICMDAKLQEDVEACVLKTCTLRQSLSE